MYVWVLWMLDSLLVQAVNDSLSLSLSHFIYIYIYRILSPVKPELGVIPSGQENIREYLDLPGKELNVSIIQSNIFIKKKQRNQSQRIINLFQSCYAFLKFSKTRKKLTGLHQIN